MSERERWEIYDHGTYTRVATTESVIEVYGAGHQIIARKIRRLLNEGDA